MTMHFIARCELSNNLPFCSCLFACSVRKYLEFFVNFRKLAQFYFCGR